MPSVLTNLFRRKWRLALWTLLMLVIVLNVFVFIGVPGSGMPGSRVKAKERAADIAHLQISRKGLDKSANDSSSLHYVEWDGRQGSFDPELAKKGLAINNGKQAFLDKKAQEEFDENHINEIDSPDHLGNQSGSRGQVLPADASQNKQKSAEANQQDEDRSRVGKFAKGGRANYSLPEVDDLILTFQKNLQGSIYVSDEDTPFDSFLKKLLGHRKSGPRLQTYARTRARSTWEMFHHGIRQHALYDSEEPYVKKLMRDLQKREIVDVEQKEGGTQLKLMMTYDDEGQALFKPMRFPREQETLPDHFYFADYERHNAEIAAFHLDRALGFHRVPPTVGRLLNSSSEIHHLADSKLAKTFFVSPAGNWCFHGSCSYYCDSSHPICGHPMMLEGSLAAFLPPLQMAKRKTWRNPWKRSYSKHRKAYWEVYDDLCVKVKTKHPYNEGRRLLDVLDMSVFDFLTGNLDRHHYETFREFGNDTFLLHLDNGRAFGKSKYDCISCLAPVRQCCMIRASTMAKLVKFYVGPSSLSELMRRSLAEDALNPILAEGHLDALDRRVSKILHIIGGCLKEGRSWNEVIVDDGIT